MGVPALAVALLVAVVGLAIQSLASVDATTELIVEDRYPKTVAAADLRKTRAKIPGANSAWFRGSLASWSRWVWR